GSGRRVTERRLADHPGHDAYSARWGPRPVPAGEVLAMAVTVAQMLGMSRRQLDDVFRGQAAGEIPSGEGRGTVLVRWGRSLSTFLSKVVHRLAWQGKVFNPERGELRNEVSPF